MPALKAEKTGRKMIPPEKKPENSEIPHIFHVIPSFAHGGVPIRISYLMNHFGPRARHTLLSTDNIYSCQSRLNKDVDYSILDIGLGGQSNIKSNIISRIWQYRRSLGRINPDLLLTYNWGSTEWALANSIAPLCRHYHLESGFGPEEAEKTLPRRNWFRRLALRNIKGIIVPSHTLINICKNDWKIPESRIRYIPNGVDCDLYSSAPEPGIIGGFKKQPGQIVIGTMTPLRPEKNLPRLITAFHHLTQSCPKQNFALIIMGEGRERPALEKLIAHYGLEDNIYLPGHVDRPAFALGWLDIYALSSDTEQMPNAVNQAMAAGLPVVGLDVGDVKFMVHDNNKPYIAPAGNDPAFAKALTDMATNKKRREEIGRVNKKHVKDSFDQSRMFREYGKIWRVAPER